MGRKSLKSTRQKEIIKVFYKVAKKIGLENTSIAKIAQEMDINPSLIMHYFKTKEDLTKGLIDYILDKYLMIYAVKSSDSAIDRLRGVLDNLFSAKWNRLVDDGLFYSCYALSFRDKKVKELYKALHDRLRASLAELILECKLQNGLKVGNPGHAAQVVYVLVDGAYYYLKLVSDKAEYSQKLAIYKEQAFQVLGLGLQV
ncbi:transcriptional regulator, TetR family [bacterium A37T11]|nr:transcriptional regulator, TetR family [bacterium A37T11]